MFTSAPGPRRKWLDKDVEEKPRRPEDSKKDTSKQKPPQRERSRSPRRDSEESAEGGEQSETKLDAEMDTKVDEKQQPVEDSAHQADLGVDSALAGEPASWGEAILAGWQEIDQKGNGDCGWRALADNWAWRKDGQALGEQECVQQANWFRTASVRYIRSHAGKYRASIPGADVSEEAWDAFLKAGGTSADEFKAKADGALEAYLDKAVKPGHWICARLLQATADRFGTAIVVWKIGEANAVDRRFVIAPAFSRGWPRVNSKSPPLVILLKSNHYTSLRTPPEGNVPWTWLRETNLPGPEDLPGGADHEDKVPATQADDECELASVSVHTLCPSGALQVQKDRVEDSKSGQVLGVPVLVFDPKPPVEQQQGTKRPKLGKDAESSRSSAQLGHAVGKFDTVPVQGDLSDNGLALSPECKKSNLPKTVSEPILDRDLSVCSAASMVVPSLHTLAGPVLGLEAETRGSAKRAHCDTEATLSLRTLAPDRTEQKPQTEQPGAGLSHVQEPTQDRMPASGGGSLAISTQRRRLRRKQHPLGEDDDMEQDPLTFFEKSGFRRNRVSTVSWPCPICKVVFTWTGHDKALSKKQRHMKLEHNTRLSEVGGSKSDKMKKQWQENPVQFVSQALGPLKRQCSALSSFRTSRDTTWRMQLLLGFLPASRKRGFAVSALLKGPRDSSLKERVSQKSGATKSQTGGWASRPPTEKLSPRPVV